MVRQNQFPPKYGVLQLWEGLGGVGPSSGCGMQRFATACNSFATLFKKGVASSIVTGDGVGMGGWLALFLTYATKQHF